MAARRPEGSVSPAAADEHRLVEAAQLDLTRFSDLYEMHFERVYAFIARRVRDREAAEDLTSHVFHNALANLGNYEFRGVSFAAWLIKIAANAVADQIKRSVGAQRTTRQLRDPNDVPDPSAGPDLETVETRARLSQLVNQLPTDQRRVILQRFIEEKSIREIAQQLGRSEGAVKQLQFRALKHLRTQMESAHV